MSLPCKDTTVPGLAQRLQTAQPASPMETQALPLPVATAASRDGVELLSRWPPSPEWGVSGLAPLCPTSLCF